MVYPVISTFVEVMSRIYIWTMSYNAADQLFSIESNIYGMSFSCQKNYITKLCFLTKK
jgi:hypothetical protein